MLTNISLNNPRLHNKTPFSGLETHIRNCYTNPLVQVMHYTMPIRYLAKSHITTACQQEHCMLCELGFVSRMLEDARGVNCQSGNFCKTITNMYHCTSHHSDQVKILILS